MISNHIVKSYDDELQQLKSHVAQMGDYTKSQFEKTLESLNTRDREKALSVIEQDFKIDALETEIDQKAFQILALRQPVALDLRIVIAALKIANHFERIGDYSANISRRVLLLNDPGMLIPEIPSLLLKMGESICEMLHQVLLGIQEQNPAMLEKIWKQDVEVDSLYTSLFRELLTYMMEDPRQITPCTHLLFIAKNMERIGDHITSIAEIFYVSMTGKRLEASRPHPSR
ncbi:MAG: phosphate signaling complex protein PhoU [Alphaproteobacteria bacterium]